MVGEVVEVQKVLKTVPTATAPRACQKPMSARMLVQHSGDAVLSTGIQFHSRAVSEFENKGRGPTKRCGVLLLARPSMPSSNLACSRMQKWAA